MVPQRSPATMPSLSSRTLAQHAEGRVYAKDAPATRGRYRQTRVSGSFQSAFVFQTNFVATIAHIHDLPQHGSKLAGKRLFPSPRRSEKEARCRCSIALHRRTHVHIKGADAFAVVCMPLQVARIPQLSSSSMSARSFGFKQSRESKPTAPNSYRCHQPDGRRWSVDHHEVISKNRDASLTDHLEIGEYP
jgi:hypothetical protein